MRARKGSASGRADLCPKKEQKADARLVVDEPREQDAGGRVFATPTTQSFGTRIESRRGVPGARGKSGGVGPGLLEVMKMF